MSTCKLQVDIKLYESLYCYLMIDFGITKSPGALIKTLLEEKDLTQEDLAIITGLSRQFVNKLISGRSTITPKTAISLATALGGEASEWLRLDSEHRLRFITKDVSDVEKRAVILETAPIRDMQRRGWLSDTDNFEKLEVELKEFFETEDLRSELNFHAAYKRTAKLPNLNKAERAWFFQAKRIAKALPTARFDESKLSKLEKELRRVAAYAKETYRVSQILGSYGIRFMVIEPLPRAQIDGAAFWLDESSPVIAVSIRFDNIGSFWFTLMHELKHIQYKDALSIDGDIEEGFRHPESLGEDSIEQRANEGAAASLIDPEELDSFIRRVSPLYSRQKIIQFAHRIKIHPGIIVGQLQHRKEIPFSSHRQLMANVRDVATEIALTDGWGKTLPIGI